MAPRGRHGGFFRLLRPVRLEASDSLMEGGALLVGDGGLVGRNRLACNWFHPWVGWSGRRGLRRGVDEAELCPELNKSLHLCRSLTRVLDGACGARLHEFRVPRAQAAVVGHCEYEFRAIGLVCQPSQSLHLIPAIVEAATVLNLGGVRGAASQDVQVAGVRHRE